jgi:hypothetical protein
MNRIAKITLVLGGYATALLVAIVAFYLRQLATQGPDAQASSGMYAFGDAVLFLGVLGVLSVFPTALALFFLRPYEKVWRFYSVASLAFASTALAAELVNTALRVFGLYQSHWMVLGFFTLQRVFATPIFTLGFFICAFLAPDKRSRRSLLIAAGIEVAVGGYALIHLLIWQHFA